jgi:hypothetical protein
MPTTSSIVLYGYDQILNYTRGTILDRAGFSVVAASSPKDLELIASVCTIDLLILCQTVSGEEQRKLIAVVRAFHPSLVSFSMNEILPNFGGYVTSHDSSAFVSAMNLIAAVEEILSSRRSNSSDSSNVQ